MFVSLAVFAAAAPFLDEVCLAVAPDKVMRVDVYYFQFGRETEGKAEP